jgi:DNA-binding LacI/PurR family transcriptional regulator
MPIGYQQETPAMPARRPSGAALTSEVAERIRGEYLSGKGAPVRFLPSERVLAEALGVARTTVRKALRLLADEGLVRAEHGRGYRTLPRAAGLTAGGRLAILQPPPVPGSGGGGIGEQLIMALQRAVLAQGGQALFIDAANIPLDRLVGSLHDARVWGVALTTDDDRVFRALAGAGMPCAAVDCPARSLPMDYIAQDNFGGARAAADYLLEGEHRDIAWFGPVAASHHSLLRFAGAQSAFHSRGRELPRKRVTVPSEDAEASARQLLSRKNRPTAVLALWAGLGVAVGRAAAQLNLKLGDDLELVTWTTENGYRNRIQREFGVKTAPPTVVWNTDEMAEITVDRLLWHLREPDLKPLRISVPTRLVATHQDL